MHEWCDTVKIDLNKCSGCRNCIPYCPINAIKIEAGEPSRAYINQEECVECGVCIRSGVCATRAFYVQEMSWPRTIRPLFSGAGRTLVSIDKSLKLPRRSFEDVLEEQKGLGGRGTTDMKTIDLTGNLPPGDVDIAVELGRPALGVSFRDLEKVSSSLARYGIEFDPSNNVTKIINTNTGKIKEEYREVLDERALSAVIKCKAPMEEVADVFDVLEKVAGEIDTVFTLFLVNRCVNGEIPLLPMLEDHGIKIRHNGKTNMGLGRPLIL